MQDDQERVKQQDPSPEDQTDPVSEFERLLDEEGGFDIPSRGDVIEGIVVSDKPGEIRIDIGGKSEGVISNRELDNMSRDERSQFEVGQKLQVYVVNPEDREGNPILSLAKAEEEADWRWVEDLQENQDIFKGEICGYNKGGLLVQMKNLRGFVPGSQLDNFRHRARRGATPEEQWGHLVREPIQVKVIEVDRSRNRLILSERATIKEMRERAKEKLLEELQEGQIRDGQVINLADFGAFVDLGGADGLIHLSELSWKHISHPREVVNVGEEIKVYVLNVDRERRRIGLSLKRLDPDPWWEIEENLPEGTLVQGTITKLTNFGAFARLSLYNDFEGLIHISELSEAHVEHPREVVEDGQLVTVRVIRVDTERRRLGLSLKRVTSDEYIESDLSSLAQIQEGEAVDHATDESE